MYMHVIACAWTDINLHTPYHKTPNDYNVLTTLRSQGRYHRPYDGSTTAQAGSPDSYSFSRCTLLGFCDGCKQCLSGKRDTHMDSTRHLLVGTFQLEYLNILSGCMLATAVCV